MVNRVIKLDNEIETDNLYIILADVKSGDGDMYSTLPAYENIVAVRCSWSNLAAILSHTLADTYT